ncbi:MAG: YbjN domain-containing protein [Chloroflexi bacterium]|nr:YbjN domain-containing protein [Chloroflexota bacterium]
MAQTGEQKGSIFDAMVQFFEEDGWRFQQLEGKPIIRMLFSGENGTWMCYAQAREEHQRFLFYSVMESKVPLEKRLAVAEYLTRANYGLILGNFELDLSDGEVRYKTSIDVEGGQLTSQMIRNMVYANLMMMDKYLPGIMKVVYGDIAPADAIAQIEKSAATS